MDNIKLLVDKAEKQKISEDNELLKNLGEIYTSIEAIRAETEKEDVNSVNVTKARELIEKILESGVIFEEYYVIKAMFEKKPKAKQIGVKSRSQKITDSQVLRELIEECDKDSDVLDEATKALLIEKKQVILDWLDGKKDFNANKIDDIEIEEIASLLDLLKSLKATISEENMRKKHVTPGTPSRWRTCPRTLGSRSRSQRASRTGHVCGGGDRHERGGVEIAEGEYRLLAMIASRRQDIEVVSVAVLKSHATM